MNPITRYTAGDERPAQVLADVLARAGAAPAAPGHRFRALQDPRPLTWVGIMPDGAQLLTGALAATTPSHLLAFSRWTLAGGAGGPDCWRPARGELARHLRRGAFNRYFIRFGGACHLTVGADGLLHIWEAETGKLLHCLPTGMADNLTTSVDGTRVATARGGRAAVWQAATGRLIGRFRSIGIAEHTLDRHGDHLLTLAGDALCLWQVATQDLLAQIDADGLEVRYLCLSHCARWCYANSEPGTVHVWRLQSGELRIEVPGVVHSGAPVCLFPDGATLATAMCDGSIQLRDVPTGALLATLRQLGDDGFLWHTPPDPPHAPDGWFWTSDTEVVEVVERSAGGEARPVVDPARIAAYLQAYNRREMVLDRIARERGGGREHLDWLTALTQGPSRGARLLPRPDGGAA